MPTSLPPCCDHTPPTSVYTHAAPVLESSNGPPTMAVLPSAEIAADQPCSASPTAPVPTSLLPSCDHTPPLHVYSHAAPALKLSYGAPTRAVLPFPEIATDLPNLATPTAPVPTSLRPCCDHTPALRVNTHAAPAKTLSPYPPTMAVLPSAETATE